MSEQFLGRFDVDFKGVKPGRESMTEDVVTHPTEATMTVRIAEGDNSMPTKTNCSDRVS